MKKSSQTIIVNIISVAVIGIMVLVSELIHSKEVIFPEISAISLGALISPKFAWNTSKAKMIICITVCAICGYSISAFLPLNIYFKLLIAFIIGNIVLIFSRTSFAPMLSAIILPVILKTDSIIYPISAFSITVVIVALLYLFETTGIKGTYFYEPNTINLKKDSIAFFKRFVIYAILSYLSVISNCMIALAPPLVVAFTELCNPNSKARKYPVNICFIMMISAFTGEMTRQIFCTLYGLPLFVGVIVAVSIMIIILDTLKIYIPPMLAITTLAYLVKANTVPYTVQITVGFSLLMLCAIVLFKDKKPVLSDNK
ncbi:MAG: hypothetical protein IJU14_00705 [Clostridia bacterium]|nr:hypothetical protein [Clostridia bacterium]